jgi:hypothetical protein
MMLDWPQIAARLRATAAPRSILLVVLRLGVACSKHPTESGNAAVEIELYRVAFVADGLRYRRDAVPLGRGDNAPDQTVRSITKNSPSISLFHSTSWRYEQPNKVVLTYLATTSNDDLAMSSAVELHINDLPGLGPTDPLHPRPKEIRELDVLAHGLRHLAFLVRVEPNGAAARAMPSDGLSLLTRLAPTLAGELPQPK